VRLDHGELTYRTVEQPPRLPVSAEPAGGGIDTPASPLERVLFGREFTIRRWGQGACSCLIACRARQSGSSGGRDTHVPQIARDEMAGLLRLAGEPAMAIVRDSATSRRRVVTSW